MANKDLIFFDFETTGRNKHNCQLTQVAALAIDGRSLRLKGTFNSEIKPLYFDDEEAIANGWGPIEDEALKVTRKTIEQLKQAPTLDSVWPKFTKFVEKYNYKKTAWTAPIPCGYNIIGYDLPILDRICKLYGPWDEKKQEQKLFHPINKIDMMDNMYMWTEGDPTIKSISMDNVRKRTGMSTDNAHDALQDVKDGANLMIKFIETHRAVYKKLNIDNCFSSKGSLYIE